MIIRERDLSRPNGEASPSHPPYEVFRLQHAERLLAKVRFYFAAFCIAILLIGSSTLGIPSWGLVSFAAAATAYATVRLLRPCCPTTYRQWPLPVDLLDFVFIGWLIFLTGGARSAFRAAYMLPVFGATMRFGLGGGAKGIAISVLIEAAAMVFPSSTPLPSALGAAAEIGTLAFATFMVGCMVHSEREARRQLYRSSITDELTGLFNLGYLRQLVEGEILGSAQKDRPYSIAFLDLDCFKAVNDRYGHSVGDAALVHVAGTLRRAVREGEILARYGGDEFVMLMPGASRREAEAAARRLSRRVAAAPFHDGSVEIPLRLAYGVAVFPEDGDRFERLLAAADQRMYEAKCVTQAFNDGIIGR